MRPFIFTPAERLRTQLCPVCAHTIDACTGITGRSLPRPGDYTVCAECISLLQLGSDGALRRIELSDVVPAMRETIQQVMDAGRATRQQLSQTAVSRTGVVN